MPRARSPNPIPAPPAKLTREARVEELLVQGHRTGAVQRLVAAEFSVSEDTIKGDVAAIRDRWAVESTATRPAKRAELEAQADDLYRRCVEANDRKAAVAALQLKADLHGARMRPMAALVQPGAAPASVDAWLSGVLGLAPPTAGEGGGEGGGS